MCCLYRGFVFLLSLKSFSHLTTEEFREKERKTLKSQLFVCVLQGGYGVVKKSSIFEKVKTRVTMVTKIMIFFDNYHFERTYTRRKRVFRKK